MRLRSLALVGGSLVLLLILGAMTLSFTRVRPMGVSIGVHSYQRQGDELFACLVLTNTGAVSLAVPLRFGCQVDRGRGVTNYYVGTRHEAWLQPRQHVILPNALWLECESSVLEIPEALLEYPELQENERNGA